MCGLIASFSTSGDPEAAVRRAMDRMARRGPDGEGVWMEPGVALGHRRLAVIDLDSRAAQPMVSSCGRYVIVFNGEIYNFRALRDRLSGQGVAFRTSSDTEVLLALFATEGAAMLPRLQGMFAFVIWDRAARRAFAARDPYGIKPLYTAVTGTGVMVASQVRALLAAGGVSRAPDPRGQAGFWMLGSVPEPHTWFRDVRAVPAGHHVWVEDTRLSAPECWADVGRAWREAPPAVMSGDEVRARVRAAVRESVDRHLVADVPIGLFLSGGIDSGAIAALMGESGARGITGVTLAYDEFTGRREDEAPAASLMATHCGIRHHIRRVGREELAEDLPRILDAMDQPSIDGINTWYASKAAAELGLKVVMSGVGGDELFQGYASFDTLPRLVRQWRTLSRVPGLHAVGRAAGAYQARRTANGRWRFAAEWGLTIAGAWWLRRSLFPPDALPGLMGQELAAEALRGFEVSQWVTAMSGVLPSDGRLALGQIESTTYLRNQLLRDSDWASMDHGLELRTPLVDARLLMSLQPVLASFSRHPGKAMLAAAPERALPRQIVDRPKTGFGIPLGRWLADGRSGDTTAASDSRMWAARVAGAWNGGAP